MANNPNVRYHGHRTGLDKFIDQRNRIVAMDVSDPSCSELRDDIVLAFDILTQILIEHFPLMRDSK